MSVCELQGCLDKGSDLLGRASWAGTPGLSLILRHLKACTQNAVLAPCYPVDDLLAFLLRGGLGHYLGGYLSLFSLDQAQVLDKAL